MLFIARDAHFHLSDRLFNLCDTPFRTNPMPATPRNARNRFIAAPETARMPKLRVGFVLAPHFTLTAFAGFADALRLAADDGDRSRPIDIVWSVLGNGGVPVISSCGALVQPWAEMANPENFDCIVVVGGLLHGGQKVLPGTYPFLKAAARAGVTLMGLCTGSFILARAGLLEGYVACVSWFHREEFVGEFPDQRLITNKMFVVDRDRMTCAGGTSVVHLAAHLIEKYCGRALANKSLRILIEDQPLPSSTAQPESVVTRQAQDSVVRQAMLLIEQKLSQSDPLTDISASLGISIRQLERKFVADVGITPRDYRLHLRLARARWMIEHTDLSVTDVGFECGFGDCSHFSRAFTSHFKVRPSSLRRPA